MSAKDDPKLPPLPEAAAPALSAFRSERPSAHLEARLHLALRKAEEARASAPATPARVPTGRESLARTYARSPATPVLLGAVMASALVILVLRMDGAPRVGDGAELRTESLSLPSHHVAFQLPEDGAGWLELPWTHGVHIGEPATVRLETPAELNFHQHATDLPALQLVSCDDGRCIHQFTADTGESALPLRVRIDKPGRYEFRVSHASDAREVHEHFVVQVAH